MAVNRNWPTGLTRAYVPGNEKKRATEGALKKVHTFKLIPHPRMSVLMLVPGFFFSSCFFRYDKKKYIRIKNMRKAERENNRLTTAKLDFATCKSSSVGATEYYSA